MPPLENAESKFPKSNASANSATCPRNARSFAAGHGPVNTFCSRVDEAPVQQPEQDSGTNTTRADLKALAQAASEPNPDQRLQAVGRFLDVDRFLTFVAMETLTARWDGYARNRANYRLYHDPTTERMVFIPHGMVGAFAGTNVTALPPTRRLLGKAVFQTEPGRRAHRQRLRELFERFKVEATGEGVNRFEDAYYRAWPLR